MDYTEATTKQLERMQVRLFEDIKFAEDATTKQHFIKMYEAICYELSVRRNKPHFPGMKAAIQLWSAGKSL